VLERVKDLSPFGENGETDAGARDKRLDDMLVGSIEPRERDDKAFAVAQDPHGAPDFGPLDRDGTARFQRERKTEAAHQSICIIGFRQRCAGRDGHAERERKIPGRGLVREDVERLRVCDRDARVQRFSVRHEPDDAAIIAGNEERVSVGVDQAANKVPPSQRVEIVGRREMAERDMPRKQCRRFNLCAGVNLEPSSPERSHHAQKRAQIIAENENGPRRICAPRPRKRDDFPRVVRRCRRWRARKAVRSWFHLIRVLKRGRRCAIIVCLQYE
jgi:hypothetical protein